MLGSMYLIYGENGVYLSDVRGVLMFCIDSEVTLRDLP